MTTADVLTALQRINERLDELGHGVSPDVILTRDQAAKQLKVSVRQLQRLIRAGRIMAHPSGIAYCELERYASTPQTKLTDAVRETRRKSITEDVAEGRALLKLRRKRR